MDKLSELILQSDHKGVINLGYASYGSAVVKKIKPRFQFQFFGDHQGSRHLVHDSEITEIGV